jgi:hypothetical protein
MSNTTGNIIVIIIISSSVRIEPSGYGRHPPLGIHPFLVIYTSFKIFDPLTGNIRGWTEEESKTARKFRGGDARPNRCLVNNRGSAEYWDHTIEENTADRELNDLRWEADQRGLERSAYERAQEAYLERRQEIESKRASLSRKADRFGKMRVFLSTTQTDSLVSLRAAYLELHGLYAPG